MFKFKKLDDEMHFWAGMLISLFVFIPFTFIFSQWLSGVFAFGIASAIGVSKEWYDKNIKNTRFDDRDLKWTMIGASIIPAIFIIADIIYYYS